MQKDIILNTIGNLIYNMCQFCLSVLAVRFSANYNNAGYLSLAMTTSSTFSMIALFGMRNFQISDARNEFSQNEYISSRALTCTISFICCILGAIPGNNRYQIFCIYAFMICRVSEAISDVLYGIDQKNCKYNVICKSMVARGLLLVASFSITLILFDNLLLSIIIMSSLNLMFVIAYDGKLVDTENKIIISFTSRQKILLRKCFPIFAYTFILSLITLMPKYFLQQVCGTNVLGIYSSITSPTLAVQLIASVAASPVVPKISKYFEDRDETNYFIVLRRLYLAIIAMAIVSIFGAKIFGKWGLTLLYGKDIIRYYNIFMPAIACTIELATVWILYSIVVVIRKMNIMLIGMIFAFIIVLLISKPLITKFGMNGANYAQIIGYGLYIPFLIIIIETYSRRELKKDSHLR